MRIRVLLFVILLVLGCSGCWTTFGLGAPFGLGATAPIGQASGSKPFLAVRYTYWADQEPGQEQGPAREWSQWKRARPNKR